MVQPTPKNSEYIPLYPDRFYLKAVVLRQRYLGIGSASQMDELIKTGEIDPPVTMSERGRPGWFGRALIRMQAKREAAAKRETVAA